MGRSGNCNFDELFKLRENLNRLEQSDIDAFCISCAKEITARLLSKVIKRTPVGVYDEPVSFTTKEGKEVSFTPHSGKKGGTLRRGWTAARQNIQVVHTGDKYQITIINPVQYADYVEFGHRTANHAGWVKGQFMLTISEQEIRGQSQQIIQNKLRKLLGECFND